MWSTFQQYLWHSFSFLCITLCDFCWLTYNIQMKQEKKPKTIQTRRKLASKLILPFLPTSKLHLQMQLQLVSICVASKGQLEPRECSHTGRKVHPSTDTEAYQSQKDPEGDCSIHRVLSFVKNRIISPPPVIMLMLSSASEVGR